jgi:ribonuclease HIII
LNLPKGAGPPVESAAAAFLAKHGAEALGRVAKLHFKTTARVLSGL